MICGVLIALARMATNATSTRVQSNDDISPSMQVLIVKFVRVLFYAAAFFVGIRAIGIDLTGLAVLSGAIGVGRALVYKKLCPTSYPG